MRIAALVRYIPDTREQPRLDRGVEHLSHGALAARTAP